MKLLVTCHNCNVPLTLNLQVANRSELRALYGEYVQLICSNCGQQHPYHVREITAQKADSKVGASAIVGGVVGLLGGPIGALIGLGLGAALGNGSDDLESKSVSAFNDSY
jgi:hypothetical protein